MKAKDLIGALLVVAIVAAGALWLFREQLGLAAKTEPAPAVVEHRPESILEPGRALTPPPPEVADDAPASPNEDPAVAPAPLPSLQDSDEPVRQSLIDLFGLDVVEQYLLPQALIMRFVVMVDNLPNPNLTAKMRSIRKVGGDFVVEQRDDRIYLSDANPARYAALVQALQVADMSRVAAFYRQHYRLFQQAYDQLGYSQRSFNQRFAYVLDHLLATPQVEGPIELLRPRFFYEFADPQLQALSSGQKAMLRLGAGNRVIVEAKLSELRRLISQLPPS
ncbi:DUF3014 domain-containing protein [Hydrocarboniphaga effusa]|uniref:DUF3014 domain-containing protein n=1 Tax=Hydrocarboniphaga effusa AP103 TaxID=1172194 RepID=I7ZAY3_9GAMM|nr:DUF3014 domain-containing protein [Hydrocarboniphaga effusa]EIT68999.1 hypothetical protein WQQ_25810 [Hydrocarboniphaga effusa AP103]